jgi:hypothetical protein
MTTYQVGYFVGSLATASINRLLAKALMQPARLLQLAPDERSRGVHSLYAGTRQRGGSGSRMRRPRPFCATS